MAIAWIGDAKIVLMERDYTTSSFNLGERTYEEGKAYQLSSAILNEIIK